MGSNAGTCFVARTQLSDGTDELDSLEGVLNLLLDFVEAFAGGRPVGLVDLPQSLLDRLQPAALGAQELNARGLQGGRILRCIERSRRVAGQGVQF